MVAYRSESRSHCEQDRGKRRQRDGKEVEYTGSKEGRGEENGTKGDVSLSACSQNIKGKGKQRTVETEERGVEDDMSLSLL